LRVLFDKNVPVGVRRLLAGHSVATMSEMGWPEVLENGELLRTAEVAGFEVLVTSDQNIRYQQNLTSRRIALVVLGSNVWPIVRQHGESIAAAVHIAAANSFQFIEMPLPPKRRAETAG
jgi:hypothetical protein